MIYTMDLKNTTILLIFLLCIVGLIAGVYYTEANEPVKNAKNYDEVVKVDNNGTITIHLEKKDNESNMINKFFT